MILNCNSCAETEGGVAPCIFEVPKCLGVPPVLYCPVSGEKADWDIVPDELTSKVERVHKSAVGAEAPSCIPTARSQSAVSDNPPSAQARPASNTSQLAIAAREVLDILTKCNGSIACRCVDKLRSALQQQA